jgi:hypothetical protein
MTHRTHSRFSVSQLVWVGVIAAVAAVLTTWLRTESLELTLLFAAASALISVAIVWFVNWTRHR